VKQVPPQSWRRRIEVTEANNDEVICPNCVHQFRAIPINVQDDIESLREQLADSFEERDRLRDRIVGCEEFLKENETLRERMLRFAVDVESALLRESKLKDKLAAVTKERDKLKAVCEGHYQEAMKNGHALVACERERDALEETEQKLLRELNNMTMARDYWRGFAEAEASQHTDTITELSNTIKERDFVLGKLALCDSHIAACEKERDDALEREHHWNDLYIKSEKDAERYRWILPIVTGDDSDEADKRAMAIATQLMKGLDGDDAIDAARSEK
jgi:chromosome segregation ATPase